MSKRKIIKEFGKVKHYLPVNSLSGFEAGYTCLQKENKELRELLKEADTMIENSDCYGWQHWQNKYEALLERYKV